MSHWNVEKLGDAPAAILTPRGWFRIAAFRVVCEYGVSMQGMREGMSHNGGKIGLLKPQLVAAALVCAALAGGCGTAIDTPLPEFRPIAATSLTQAEKAKAVEELNNKRATHEQDAEAAIEQAR